MTQIVPGGSVCLESPCLSRPADSATNLELQMWILRMDVPLQAAGLAPILTVAMVGLRRDPAPLARKSMSGQRHFLCGSERADFSQVLLEAHRTMRDCSDVQRKALETGWGRPRPERPAR